jgi:flagellar assembly protein FliH
MKWCKTISPGRLLQDVRLSWRFERLAGGQAAEAARDQEREQAAFERGVAEGEKRLSEQLLRQRGELLELQNGVLATLRQTIPQVIRKSESALIQLAVEVASKLVSGLPVTTEMVESAVRSALAQVQEATEFDVYVHADDLALLKQCNSPVLLPSPGHEAVRFHASDEVTRGGCLVETRFGLIDARRETKLKLIHQSLGQ